MLQIVLIGQVGLLWIVRVGQVRWLSFSWLLGIDPVWVSILVWEHLLVHRFLGYSGGRGDSIEVRTICLGLSTLRGTIISLQWVVVVGGIAI